MTNKKHTSRTIGRALVGLALGAAVSVAAAAQDNTNYRPAPNDPFPKPTTALLLGEMQITGIFRTPRGYAAMVEATPIKLSYVIYPGERFFDGQLVAIEEGRLVFRRERRWSDGRRETSVETKALRKT